MKKTLFSIICLVIFTFGIITQIVAQSATATLSGTVTDESGAVVPSANVTITDNAKSFERTVITSGEGNFIFTQLPPSSYTVKPCKLALLKRVFLMSFLMSMIKAVCEFN